MEQKRRIVPPVYFLGALILMAALHYRLPIRGEERFLEEIFGAAYRDYKQRVRRWL
jgi:protein-S-isoprenylcysteine O-methyltransferase Ste14